MSLAQEFREFLFTKTNEKQQQERNMRNTGHLFWDCLDAVNGEGRLLGGSHSGGAKAKMELQSSTTWFSNPSDSARCFKEDVSRQMRDKLCLGRAVSS